MRRNRNTLWSLRKDGPDSLRTGVSLSRWNEDIVLVWVSGYLAASLQRKDARLLAKRINQCLDETPRIRFK